MDLDSRLVETATKVVVSRNEYGDTLYGATSSVACLFRDISSLASGGNKTSNREDVTIDGLLWFAANATVSRGDIYNHATEGYLRIEKIILGKSLLTDNAIHFIKCEVSRQRQIS